MALPRRKATGFRAFPPGGLPTLAAQTPLPGFVMNMGRRKQFRRFLCVISPKNQPFGAQTTALASFLKFFCPPALDDNREGLTYCSHLTTGADFSAHAAVCGRPEPPRRW